MALSARGQEAAKPNEDLFYWEVIKNLWDPQTNPSGYVSLGLAENTLMHDVVAQHIHGNTALVTESFTYGDGPTGSKRLKRVLARFLGRHLQPAVPLEPDHFAVTNGCSSAVEHLSWALGNPDEGFLLGQPYYGTFIPDLSFRFGTKVIPVPFHGVDPVGIDAVAKYEGALLNAQAKGQKVAGLVLCHPHNPLGRCYPREALIGLMRLCEKYQIHFISDEIYALSVWPNRIDSDPAPEPFVSALSVDLTGVIDPARVHVIWGMSKDFGANGIRMGVLISQHNPALHAAMVPVAIYSSSSSLADHATANMLEDDAWVESYIAENRSRLAEHYELAAGWAKLHAIDYAAGVNAAFFLWVDLGRAYKARHPEREVEDVTRTVREKLLEHKVFIASGKQFGSEQDGWFRIVFSHQKALLEEGLKRIVAALEG